MADAYFERQSIEMLDGTLTFQTDADRTRENEVAAAIEEAWTRDKKERRDQLTLTHFGKLCPIDWFAKRHERVVGLLELKSPDNSINKYDCAWLNVRKWLALTMGAVGMGVPSIFVVRFNDGNIRWLPVRHIDASKHRIVGCKKVVKSASDIEPVIEIPIASMRRLTDA